MTHIRIHGILAQEYGNTFVLDISNPRNTLHAIDCNKQGFIRRIIELQKQGLCYDLIIDKTRITDSSQVDGFKRPQTIDLVPAITGSGPAIAQFFMWLGTGGFWASVTKAVIFAAISYALSPKPEEAGPLEGIAGASKESLIFSNTVNVATQGAPLPVGYGRLKVGSQVIQATIKSYPQSQKTRDALKGYSAAPVEAQGVNFAERALITSKATNQ